MIRAFTFFLLFGTSVPLIAQDLPTWRAELDLTIGSPDAPAYNLSRIGDILIGARGEILIAQPDDGRIRVYAADGRHLHDIGRRGRGPGEFSTIDRMGWAGNHLWATDPLNSRIVFFSAAGEHLRSTVVMGPVVPNSSRPAPARALFRNSTFLATPMAESSNERVTPLLLLRRSGELAGTLGVLAGSEWYNIRPVIRGRPGHVQLRHPLADHSLWAVSPSDSSVIILHRASATRPGDSHFHVQKLRAPGDTVFSRSYRYNATPVQRSHVDDVLGRHPAVETLSRFVSRSEAVQLVRDSLAIPQFEPPISAMVAGRDGTIWLRREFLGRDVVTWLVLDGGGRLTATIRLPADLRVYAADSGSLWGAVTDELDVPYVVRYRITR